MKQNIVPIATVAILALLLGLYLSGQQTTHLPQQGLLFEQQDADGIDKLLLTNHEGLLLTAYKEQGQWWVSWQSEGQVRKYAADTNKLARVVQQLHEAKKLEAKTAKAKNYARLGVEAIEDNDSQSLSLVIGLGEQQWPALIIGKNAASGYGQYVRFAEQSQSWLINVQFDMPLTYSDWLAQPVLDMDKANLEHIQARSADGQLLWQINQQGQALGLSQMPETRQLKYESVLSHTLDSLLDLEFQGLKHQTELKVEELTPQIGFQLQSKDNHILHVNVYQGGLQNYWLTTSDAEGQNWYYQISDMSFSQLNKSKEDFLQPLTTEPDGLNTPVEEGTSPQ